MSKTELTRNIENALLTYKPRSLSEFEFNYHRKQYKDLEIHYCFETKDDQIKYMIDTFLDASNETNVKSTREGLEILLKEKTGKDYTINENKFEITLMDIIDYVASKTDLLSNKNLLINFF